LYEVINALIHFHCDNGYANAPRCYVTPAFSILLLKAINTCRVL